MHKKSRLKGKVSHAVVTIALLAAGAAAIAVPGVARAQSATERFSIPAGSLVDALRAYSEQTGLQMIYSTQIVEGRSSSGVSGNMSRTEALARLLSGTGLTFRFNDDKTVLIEAAATADSGERVLGAVRVQGAQNGYSLAGSTPVNGVNGSRDVTATEGTGSYTSNALTVGSKTAQSIKDTAMAVSVITNAQIQDQNITDLTSAMRNSPGITVTRGGNSTDLQFLSRGYAITQLQIDGGAAQNMRGSANYYRPIIDMSLYDHIEIVRGATGTFNGYGDPGGVINLVRKRPLDHSQMLLELQLGSWDWHRASVDITGPLAFGGALRGRLIATHQDNNFFYRTADSNRNVISGTLEFDAGPKTLLTAGMNYQQQHETPWIFGLMRYVNGDRLPVPRSTCYCFDWSKSDQNNTEYFLQVEQKVGSNWNLKFKGTRISQRSDFAGGYLLSLRAVDPLTNLGPRANLGVDFKGDVNQDLFEITLDGSFKFLGQDQKIIIGANYSLFDPTKTAMYVPDETKPAFTNGAFDNSVVGNILNFDPENWTPIPNAYRLLDSGYDYADFRYLNAYASVEFTPLPRLHLTTSVRYSGYRSRYLSYDICNSSRIENLICSVSQRGMKLYSSPGQTIQGGNFSWPPSVQAKYDFSKQLTGYVSYTDIYVDRSNLRKEDGSVLEPVKGKNVEVGLKWLNAQQTLNFTLSSYYTRKGFNASPIGNVSDLSGQSQGTLNNQIICCYVVNRNSYDLSYGVDLEISGELSKNFQISTSYTYNYNKSNGQYLFDGSSAPVQTIAPKHMFKMWTTYRFGEDSALSGLFAGLGITARSKTFVQDSYCPVEPIHGTTSPRCPVSLVPVFYSDKGYVILSGSLGYKFSEALRIDAEFENLLDTTYLDQVGRLSSGNWYGAPRSFKVTLRGKF